MLNARNSVDATQTYREPFEGAFGGKNDIVTQYLERSGKKRFLRDPTIGAVIED